MRRKKNSLRNILFSLLAISIVIYIIQDINNSVDTMVADNGSIEDTIEATGILYKEEHLYSANIDGVIEKYYEEGTKVKSGQLILDITKKNTNEKVSIYSEQSGIITYKIDNLEDNYKIQDVLNISPNGTVVNNEVFIDNNKREFVEKNEKLFKIVKNFEYYIVITLENEQTKLFSENKYVKTRVIVDNKAHEVWGYIKKINYGSDESAFIIYYDDYFHKVYDKRYLSIELITSTHEGLKIKTNSLTKKNGMTGVYIKDASNVIRFLPVFILGSNGDETIVSIGDNRGENLRNTIQIDGKAFETIKIFDKIVLKPSKVHEGKIVK